MALVLRGLNTAGEGHKSVEAYIKDAVGEMNAEKRVDTAMEVLSTSLARTIDIVMVGKLGFYTIKPLVASGIPLM